MTYARTWSYFYYESDRSVFEGLHALASASSMGHTLVLFSDGSVGHFQQEGGDKYYECLDNTVELADWARAQIYRMENSIFRWFYKNKIKNYKRLLSKIVFIGEKQRRIYLSAVKQHVGLQ